MMTDKDIKEYNKLIKKLETQAMLKKEQDELDESYKQSLRNKKERDDKGHLDSFSDDLKNSIKKKINEKKK